MTCCARNGFEISHAIAEQWRVSALAKGSLSLASVARNGRIESGTLTTDACCRPEHLAARNVPQLGRRLAPACDVRSHPVINIAALQMVLGVLTGWFERREREAVAYLVEESRLLRLIVGW